MAGPYIPGRVGGDSKVLDRWQRYASDNSPHGLGDGNGKPKMQSSTGRMRGRDTSANCGPIATYKNSKVDRNG